MKGSPLKAQTYIDQSRDVFIDHDLLELGYSGYDFTWCNHQKEGVVV